MLVAWHPFLSSGRTPEAQSSSAPMRLPFGAKLPPIAANPPREPLRGREPR